MERCHDTKTKKLQLQRRKYGKGLCDPDDLLMVTRVGM